MSRRYSQEEMDRERKWALRYGHMNGLVEAARDVCMYCGGRAPGWKLAEGPNSAGNWTHHRQEYERPSDAKSAPVLCAASSVHARLAFLRRAEADSGAAQTLTQETKKA